MQNASTFSRFNFLLALLLAACSRPALTPSRDLRPTGMVAAFSDTDWQTVLTRVATPDGYVRWDRFDDPKSAARSSLEKYLALLAIVSPDNRPDLFSVASQRTAYWINAYNATCMYGELLLQKAPPTEQLYTTDRFEFGNRSLTLLQIETQRLNSSADPRLLFALNRSTRSSPPLRSEPYIATKINAQLTDQAARCLSDRRFVQITGQNAKLNDRLLVEHRQNFVDAYRRKVGAGGTFLQSLILQAGRRSELTAVSEWEPLPYDAALNRPILPATADSRR